MGNLYESMNNWFETNYELNENKKLVEKKVPDEDVEENELIKSIIRKRNNRANAKLTPAEKKVYDKYKLYTRNGYGGENDTLVGRRAFSDIPTNPDVNFVDMARKAPEREKKNADAFGGDTLGAFSRGTIGTEGRYIPAKDGERWGHYEQKVPASRERKLERGAKGQYSSNANSLRRWKTNDDMSDDYQSMKSAIHTRDREKKELAGIDKEYDEKRDKITSKFARDIADNEQSRNWHKGWSKDNLKNAEDRISSIRNKHRKDKNESIKNLHRRPIVEKKVPEEDRYENELIKSIINKRANRANAKLDRAEQAVADKYNITTNRFNSGVKTSVGRRNIHYAPSGEGYDDINYVDMARKGPERYKKAYETGIDVFERRFSGIGGSREGKKNEPYGKNALRQSRDRLNRVMQKDYNDVKRLASTKDNYKDDLQRVDSRYNRYRDDYIRQINDLTQKLANNDKEREETKNYHNRVIKNLSDEQRDIINKHRRNKSESLKGHRRPKKGNRSK